MLNVMLNQFSFSMKSYSYMYTIQLKVLLSEKECIDKLSRELKFPDFQKVFSSNG